MELLALASAVERMGTGCWPARPALKKLVLFKLFKVASCGTETPLAIARFVSAAWNWVKNWFSTILTSFRLIVVIVRAERFPT